MRTLFLNTKDLPDFLNNLSKEYSVYVPSKIKGKGLPCDFGFKLPTHDYLWEKLSAVKKEDLAFNDYRSIESLRAFFTRSKEKLVLSDNENKIAVFGVKACDLFCLKIQDFVFSGGEIKDPFYERRRASALLISGDCLSFKEACFCLALEINPYPGEGFDLNFSVLENGFVVDVGSDKGEEAIKASAALFAPATSQALAQREEKRNALARNLSGHLERHKIPSKDVLQEIVKAGYESDIWQAEAEKCVECGACNFVCGTCHCFLLAEDRFGNAHERVRLWDCCSYANFARVAGGANPLKLRYQRVRNRYLKKFDFFPENFAISACAGCGRCIEACPAKIDIRSVLRKLNEEKSLSAR